MQGSLGEIAIEGHLLFATDRDTALDGQRGVYSFTIGPEGGLTQNGPLVDTQGIAPNSIAVWLAAAAHPADFDRDGVVDGDDLAVLLGSWGACASCAADLDGDQAVDGNDLAILLGGWG